jgi:hypothetical protein
MRLSFPISECAIPLLLLAFSNLGLAQSATPPRLTAFSLSPNSINTSAGPATVTAAFSATGSGAGVAFIEAALVDPSGVFVLHSSKAFAPAATVTNSVLFTFPRFSSSGVWQVAAVFLMDASGNTQIMGTPDLLAAGFPVNLTVSSTADTTPPALVSLSFTPASINTTVSQADVTVNFTATDNLAGVNSLEVAFVSPSGVSTQRAKVTLTPSTAATGSATATFPRFSESGTWTLASLYLSDAAGNSLILDDSGLAALNFPTSLTVTSNTDSAPPALTQFSVSPNSISTTSASANVTVNFAATDDLSGVSSLQVTFLSPSGVATQSGTANLNPATTVTGSTAVTFPRFSEPGAWTVSSVFLTDAAGNTTLLDSDGLAAAGFPNTLTVTSTSDSTAPSLTSFSFSPTTITVSSTSANVTMSFHVTDDLSGATTFQASLLSPSGGSSVNASATFAANTSVTATAVATIPAGSEDGIWTVATVFLSDAVGNTRVLATSDLSAAGFPTQLVVHNPVGDTTPPVITPNVSPAPGVTGWNTTPVTVSWTVADPESGIASSTGCGTAQVSLSTPGLAFTCSAVNGAGLTSTASITVKVDLAPPSIVPSVTPAPNPAGWNNSPVTVTWTVADSISGIANSTGCTSTTISSSTTGTILTCSAIDNAGLSNSVSVTIKLDLTAPTASGTTATPNPVAVNTAVNLSSVVTDTGGSNVASAQYNVDGGVFSPMTGVFGGATANVSATIPAYSDAGVHQVCVRGTDIAGNVGTTDCLILAVYDPTAGFVTGSGNTNSPAGAYLANPSTTGTLTVGFAFKYLKGATTPTGNLEAQFKAGNIDFKSTSLDFLVVTDEPRAQIQGAGTINGSLVCKFQLDSWSGSFQPGNVDAFGLKIYSCSDGTNPYNLTTAPLTHGSIQIHQ